VAKQTTKLKMSKDHCQIHILNLQNVLGYEIIANIGVRAQGGGRSYEKLRRHAVGSRAESGGRVLGEGAARPSPPPRRSGGAV